MRSLEQRYQSLKYIDGIGKGDVKKVGTVRGSGVSGGASRRLRQVLGGVPGTLICAASGIDVLFANARISSCRCHSFLLHASASGGSDSENGAETYIGEGADLSAESRKWAVENGIIRDKGYGADGKLDFAWGDTVTREEMAVMLERLAKK